MLYFVQNEVRSKFNNIFNQSKTRFLFYNQNVNCQYDIILIWVWTFRYFILWDFPNVTTWKKTCVNLKSNCFRAFNVRLCNTLYACASELLPNVLIFLGQRAIKYSWFSSEIRISTSGNTKQLLCCNKVNVASRIKHKPTDIGWTLWLHHNLFAMLPL